MSSAINKVFYHQFVQLGFAIAEYNDCPKIEKKKKKREGGRKPEGEGEVVCPEKSVQILENQVNCPGFA